MKAGGQAWGEHIPCALADKEEAANHVAAEQALGVLAGDLPMEPGREISAVACAAEQSQQTTADPHPQSCRPSEEEVRASAAHSTSADTPLGAK